MAELQHIFICRTDDFKFYIRSQFLFLIEINFNVNEYLAIFIFIISNCELITKIGIVIIAISSSYRNIHISWLRIIH